MSRCVIMPTECAVLLKARFHVSSICVELYRSCLESSIVLLSCWSRLVHNHCLVLSQQMIHVCCHQVSNVIGSYRSLYYCFVNVMSKNLLCLTLTTRQCCFVVKSLYLLLFDRFDVRDDRHCLAFLYF